MSNGNHGTNSGPTSSTGTLRGNTITLDEAVPPLDGQRVRVIIEPAQETKLSADEQATLWNHWVERGPQGPIDDEGEPEFP